VIEYQDLEPHEKRMFSRLCYWLCHYSEACPEVGPCFGYASDIMREAGKLGISITREQAQAINDSVLNRRRGC
jgi:hypothetical protein